MSGERKTWKHGDVSFLFDPKTVKDGSNLSLSFKIDNDRRQFRVTEVEGGEIQAVERKSARRRSKWGNLSSPETLHLIKTAWNALRARAASASAPASPASSASSTPANKSSAARTDAPASAPAATRRSSSPEADQQAKSSTAAGSQASTAPTTPVAGKRGPAAASPSSAAQEADATSADADSEQKTVEITGETCLFTDYLLGTIPSWVSAVYEGKRYAVKLPNGEELYKVVKSNDRIEPVAHGLDPQIAEAVKAAIKGGDFYKSTPPIIEEYMTQRESEFRAAIDSASLDLNFKGHNWIGAQVGSKFFALNQKSGELQGYVHVTEEATGQKKLRTVTKAFTPEANTLYAELADKIKALHQADLDAKAQAQAQAEAKAKAAAEAEAAEAAKAEAAASAQASHEAGTQGDGAAPASEQAGQATPAKTRSEAKLREEAKDKDEDDEATQTSSPDTDEEKPKRLQLHDNIISVKPYNGSEVSSYTDYRFGQMVYSLAGHQMTAYFAISNAGDTFHSWASITQGKIAQLQGPDAEDLNPYIDSVIDWDSNGREEYVKAEGTDSLTLLGTHVTGDDVDDLLGGPASSRSAPATSARPADEAAGSGASPSVGPVGSGGLAPVSHAKYTEVRDEPDTSTDSVRGYLSKYFGKHGQLAAARRVAAWKAHREQAKAAISQVNQKLKSGALTESTLKADPDYQLLKRLVGFAVYEDKKSAITYISTGRLFFKHPLYHIGMAVKGLVGIVVGGGLRAVFEPFFTLARELTRMHVRNKLFVGWFNQKKAGNKLAKNSDDGKGKAFARWMGRLGVNLGMGLFLAGHTAWRVLWTLVRTAVSPIEGFIWGAVMAVQANTAERITDGWFRGSADDRQHARMGRGLFGALKSIVAAANWQDAQGKTHFDRAADEGTEPAKGSVSQDAKLHLASTRFQVSSDMKPIHGWAEYFNGFALGVTLPGLVALAVVTTLVLSMTGVITVPFIASAAALLVAKLGMTTAALGAQLAAAIPAAGAIAWVGTYAVEAVVFGAAQLLALIGTGLDVLNGYFFNPHGSEFVTETVTPKDAAAETMNTLTRVFVDPAQELSSEGKAYGRLDSEQSETDPENGMAIFTAFGNFWRGLPVSNESASAAAAKADSQDLSTPLIEVS